MEENASKVYADRASSALTDPLLAVTAAGTGTSLFIINLCASIAPVQVAGKTIPGFENYKLYQVARVEDGRTRHRLRLGFFPSEADAEQVLAAVRDNYPTAFVACLSDDDRRYARGYLPDIEATASWKRPVALVPKPAAPPATSAQKEPAKSAVSMPPVTKPAAPIASAPLVATAPAASAPAKAAAPSAAKPARVESAIELDWEPEAKPAAVKPQAEQKAAAKGSAEEIELSWDPPALQTPTPAASKAASLAAAAPQTVAPVFKTEPVIKARPAETNSAAEARKPAKPVEAPRIELTLESAAVAPALPAATSKPSAEPFHVGKGADIPTTALSLESTNIQPALIAPSTAPKAPAKSPAAQSPAAKAPVAKTSTAAAAPVATPAAAPASKPAASAPVKAPLPWVANQAGNNAARPGPELDSTQTIRALTNEELNDDEKWFSIQLVVSEQPVNLDAMPHLDIFEAYRVYSIANAGSGKIVYSLRLGFFREEVSANAVGGYLKTFFPSPSVVRISTAEQLRFKDAPAPKATAAAAKSEATVIELTQARDRKPAIPTVTMEVASPADRNPTGTFKANATGAYKVDASGRHKALKHAAKTSPPATKRSAPISKTSSTGRHKTLQPKRSLQEQLLDEARDVQLSESAIRRLPKNDSLLSRLVGKLTK